MPTADRPKRVFYGWWITGASFLISFYVGGAVFYGFTAFLKPIAQDLGWSYAQISLASSLRGVEAGILAPIIGIIVDRWGPRKIIFAGSIIIAGALILLSQTTSLVMFYVSFALMALGGSCCTGVALMVPLANWFRKRIGITTGISICGYGFSGLLIPLIVRIINLYQWRGAINILAVGMVIIVTPLSLIFRHKPEQYGYLPDGDTQDTPPQTDITAKSETTENDMRLIDAIRSSSLWKIVIFSVCHGIVMNAITLHVMPYLSSIGFIESTASLVAAAVPLCSVFGRLGFGWLGDKFDRRTVIAGAFVMMGLGTLCFSYVSPSGLWLIISFLLLFGTSYGGINAVRVALSRDYYGRTKFGSIFGLVMGIGVVGGMIGPPVAGLAYDIWNSYQWVWVAFAILSIMAVISVITLPPPKKISIT